MIRSAISLLFLIFVTLTHANAARQKLKLTCPATWPHASDAKISRMSFTAELTHAGPLDFYANPQPWAAFPGHELFCAYTNGRSLLIALPGVPDKCFIEAVTPKYPFTTTKAYCTYFTADDAAKNTIRTRETEALDPATSFFGVKLGMTHERVASAVTAKGAKLHKIDDYQDVYVLADTEQLVVDYGFSPTTVLVLQLKPALGESHGPAQQMAQRFGFPDAYSEQQPWFWRGENDVRLLVPITRNIGGWTIPDEDVFLIDGKRTPDLEAQLYIDNN